MSSCTCDRYQLVAPDGSVLEGERIRDPGCREHGFPTDKWPAKHPLRRHAKLVALETGQVLTRPEASEIYVERESHFASWDSMFRDETPRETEERLYRESLGAA